jgi:DNA-binding NarL/FixJ family response regulator
VVVGRLAGLLLRGVAETLGDDHGVRILALDLSGVALERAVRRGRPGVVIVDDELVEHALLERLKSWRPAPAVLVFTRNEPQLYRTMLVAAGATCLARDIALNDLMTAVHLAASERRRRTTRRVEERLLSKAARLTDRQQDVLKCVVEGYTHRKIASDLCITVETARSHTRSVRRTLEVRSNRELYGMTFLAHTGD